MEDQFPVDYNDQTLTNQLKVFLSEESISKEMKEFFLILVFIIGYQQQKIDGVRVNLPLV